MNILMQLVSGFLLLSSFLLSSAFAKEESKDGVKSVSSKIQYVGEDSDQPRNNNVYGGSNTVNSYGGLPHNYGPFMGGREILRNPFRGSGSNSNDERGDDGYGNGQGTVGTSYPYPDTDEPDEIANGVFSNPFLGQRRRTSSTTPDYDDSENGAQPGYGRPSLGGSYWPSYGPQPGIYSSSPGFRPVVDQGYVYPVRGIISNGIGLRQPDGAYGLGIGNDYGGYPGTFRYVPASYVPRGGVNTIYGGSPRAYGQELFGYGRYPEIFYPGLGLDYGRLRDREARGVRGDESVGQKGPGLPYPQSTPSTFSSKEESDGKKAKPLRREDP